MTPPTQQEAEPTPPNGSAKHSLYVGDLDPDVDESLLYQIFSKVGPVASIRVCRDNLSRKSLGYAYVNYIPSLDPHAAQKAIQLLAYTPVKSHPMRIMWANRDASQRKSGVGNVFVKGLNPDIDSRTLHDTFEVFGPITSAKVARGEDGKSLGYGYVQYEKPESAESAVERANGMLLEGKQLYVAHYTNKDTRGGAKGYTNLYVKNIPASVKDDEGLKALFEKYGEITSAVLAKGDGFQEQEGGLKGFGFVNFKEASCAMAAVEEMNDKEIEGSKLYVAAAQKKAERKKVLEDRYEKRRREVQESTQGRNLYVKHLDPTLDDEELKKLFAKFGTITSAKIMTDENGKSRCFGFVCFSTVEEASRALGEMNNQLLAGQHLYVALAQPKAVRQAQLERDRMARLSLNMGLGMQMSPSPYGHVVPSGMGGMPQMWGPSMGPPLGGMQGRGRGRGPGRGRSQGRGAPGRGRWGGPGGRGGPGRDIRGRGIKPPGGRGEPQAAAGGSTSALASAPPEQQKIMLGEQLYPLVHRLQRDKAAKITGMLLEMDNAEVLYLIENPEALSGKVEEAVQVLTEHDVKEGVAHASWNTGFALR